jgi:hypothetical protein
MADTKKSLTLKILAKQLEIAEEQFAEAQLERLQRMAALREEESEFEFRQARRAEASEDAQRDRLFEKEKYRPSNFVYTDVYPDPAEDGKWCCQHAGVIATGDTPAMACENFDHLWMYGQ